jgi:hypothetical protein
MGPAPQAPGRCCGHGSKSTSARGRPQPVPELGYLPSGRVKTWELDTSFWCRVPSLDRVETEGRQSSVYLAQEAPDVLCFYSSGGLEVL